MERHVQILEKPLLLKSGDTGFYKVKDVSLNALLTNADVKFSLHVVEIVSDDGKFVVFKYPLKADGKLHVVRKNEIYVDLGVLAKVN